MHTSARHKTDRLDPENMASLLDGDWLVSPPADWTADDFMVLGTSGDLKKNAVFIAIGRDEWLAGTSNTTVYAHWSDTHAELPLIHKNYSAAIVQDLPDEIRQALPADFPLLQVANSYDVIRPLAERGRSKVMRDVIGITGTVGKSTVRMMLEKVLSTRFDVIGTRSNHNSRTGVALTLARCNSAPEIAVIEVALSSLWTRNGGIGPLLRPTIAIITEIGVGQAKPAATARYKARICNGIMPGGIAVLNRDMDFYDVCCKEAESYGAKVISYGFHPEADVRIRSFTPEATMSSFTVEMDGQIYSGHMARPGKGMVRNLLGVLVAACQAGMAPQAVLDSLKDFSVPKRLVTEQKKLADGGRFTLIDDSYNAEILSMKSALEVLGGYNRDGGRKKHAILGRIINLGTEAVAIHADLATSVLESGADKIYLHGKEMIGLRDALPKERLGGFFMDAPSLVDAILPKLRDGDVVLVKGDVRDTDFGSVPGLLCAEAKRADVDEIACHLVMNLHNEAIIDQCNANVPIKPGDLSQLLLLCLCAKQVVQKKITVSTLHIVPETSLVSTAKPPRVGLRIGDKVTVSQLVQAIIVSNCRDASIVLAEILYKTEQEAIKAISRLVDELGLGDTVLKSISGEPLSGQTTSLTDYARVAAYFFTTFPHLRYWFSAVDTTVGGSYRRRQGNLLADRNADYEFASAMVPHMGFAIRKGDDGWLLACAAGARDMFDLDSKRDRYLANPEKAAGIPDQTLSASGEDIRVNILGDLYFGEFYSRRRLERGISDPPTQYGYDYTASALYPLLYDSDYTIANYEAAFPGRMGKEPELGNLKPFILIGDSERTIPALKRLGVNAVALANNHSMDACADGLSEMLGKFASANITPIGAGRNISEACRPLWLRTSFGNWAIFSGYWYRRYMYQDCGFYALSQQAGANCLNGILADEIARLKFRYPDVKVLVLAHWGQDYEWVTKEQRQLARRLVDAGADLIIGSGSHMMGEVESIDGKLCFYSIGNSIFNSNGEYQERRLPGFSFLSRLVLRKNATDLYLYPILTDNKRTNYQPRTVTAEEFREGYELWLEKCAQIAIVPEHTETVDEQGVYCIQFEMTKAFLERG